MSGPWSGFVASPGARRLTVALLTLSWTGGLFAVRRPALRPVCWSFLAAIPIAWGSQAWLLHRQFLFCDGP